MSKMEKEYYSKQGISIKYKEQLSKTDRQHLIVIFSGYGVDYAFENVGKSFKCDVLWIKDEYKKKWCHYLGDNGSFQFSNAVDELISSILRDRNLSKKQCTLLGGSKGGFAALHIGLRYNYCNIVSSAFISKIGDWTKNLFPDTAKFIMGNVEDNNRVKRYNDLLIKIIVNDEFKNKNIYAFLSKSDKYYDVHQSPMLEYLKSYNNFNLIETNSPLVYDHPRVTEYNVPLIISFINSLIEGITPQFGYIVNGSHHDLVPVEKKTELKLNSNLSYCKFIGESLIIHGTAYFEGKQCSENENYIKYININSINSGISFNYLLGNKVSKIFNVKFYESFFVDYSSAGFYSNNTYQIPLSELDYGTYELEIELKKTNADLTIKSVLNSQKEFDIKYLKCGVEYRIWSYDGTVRLSKRNIFNDNAVRVFFEVKKIEIKEVKRLHLEGIFLVEGLEILSGKEAVYYLAFHQNNEVLETHVLGRSNRPYLNKIISNGYGIYQYAYFSTIGYQGVDMSGLKNGRYDISIILSYKGSIFKKKLKRNLVVEDDKYKFIYL